MGRIIKRSDNDTKADINYKICDTQGRIFEYAADERYDIPDFVSRYMKSSFCKRAFDTIYSSYQLADERESWDRLLEEEEFVKNNLYFNPDTAYWLGFVLRQLYIETGISSDKLIDIVDLNRLINSYDGLHTIDEEMATDIICQRYGLMKMP